MSRLGRAAQVLCLAVVCAVLFGTTAWAQREAPREKAPKTEAVKAEKHRVELHRTVPGRTVGKWSSMKSFTNPSPLEGTNDCFGYCTRSYCECWEDIWDPGCCEFGCNICWLFVE